MTPSRTMSRTENSSAEAEDRLASLYAAVHGPLSRYVVKLTLGDRQSAEDIVQETFVRAWRYLGQHPETAVETFQPWLYTVARRLVIDTIRALRVRPSEYITDDLTRVPAIDNDIDALIAAESIRDGLRALNSEHRTVLIELYHRGRSIADLAADLNVPAGTIKSRSYYAKQALRALLFD